MKKTYQRLLIITSMFLFLNIITLQATETKPLKDTVEVSGRATIKAKSDVAYITPIVRTENKDAKLAQQDNAKIMNQVQKDVRDKYKLTDKNISTGSYSVRPSYDYVDGKQVFRNYIVEHSLNITITDIDKVGEIVDTLVSSGATSIENIKFDVLDSTGTYNLALQKAVENAVSKAGAITTALGVKAGKPISVIEQGGSVGIMEREINMFKQDAVMAGASTSIDQNEIEITANVLVTFSY